MLKTFTFWFGIMGVVTGGEFCKYLIEDFDITIQFGLLFFPLGGFIGIFFGFCFDVYYAIKKHKSYYDNDLNFDYENKNK